MALNTEDADKIIDACAHNQVKLSVISQLRYTPAFRRLKDAVDQGLLGRLITGDVYMKFYRSQDYYDSGSWRGTWDMDGGGALMNQGIHGVDLLQYVMGPVQSVFGYARTLARNIEVEDTAVAVIEFKSGALGVIEATTSIHPGQPRRLEISGVKGTIVIEEDCITSWEIEGQQRPQDVIYKRTANRSACDPAAFSLDGHCLQIGEMVEAVKYDREPMVNQHEGRKPIEIIRAIYESSLTGKQIKL